MSAINIGMTAFTVVLWIVMYLTRHSMTRRAVRMYDLKWSEPFQRRYANIVVAASLPFYAFCLWFLWSEVGA